MASPMAPESKSRTSFNYRAVALLREGTNVRQEQAELEGPERAVARMACMGIVIGVALSLMLARLVESMLVGVKRSDPVSLSAVAALLLVTALGASWGPGWSATQVSPMVALRAE